jgi:hypothetical protein
LCDEEWCTIPFQAAGKDFRHELLDVMTNIPKIQYEMDSIKTAIIPELDTPERRLAFFELCQTTRTGAYHDILAYEVKLKNVCRIGSLAGQTEGEIRRRQVHHFKL